VLNKWQRFRRLSAPERSAFLRAIVFLPLTAAALRTIGFRRWSSLLSKPGHREDPAGQVTPESFKSAIRTARMVDAASEEGMIRANCLERSIVLWWLLNSRRLPVELQIGGRRTGKGFEAHAWVELAGTVINDRDTVGQEFALFTRDAASLRIEPR
jgi:hypothetical protein